MTVVTIDLPNTFMHQLETVAQQQQRSVADMLRDIILQKWPTLPSLPAVVETELAAFANLSNEVLWLLARSTLPTVEQAELTRLNLTAKERPLTKTESDRQQALIDAYDHILVRRAQAARILKSRGYDMSDPSVLVRP